MCIRFPYLFVEFGVDLVIIRVRVVLHDIHSTGGNIEFGPKQFVLESVGGVFVSHLDGILTSSVGPECVELISIV